MVKKIDIVYLWVDGSDANFIKLKNSCLSETGVVNSEHVESIAVNRWRDGGELKYSLRSIAKFAPWINHIYIVTGLGQVPNWLNTNNPKITIVPQESILPSDASPVFNSCAIEMCLANIPGLSEHFLLANDDMFFNRHVKPGYFFTKNGTAKVRCVKKKNGKIVGGQNVYFYHLINAARVIENAFGISLYNYKSSHGIDPYIKSSIIECCNTPIIKDEINKTKYSKFRQTTDVHRMVFNLYDYVKNRAIIIRAHGWHCGHHRILDFLYNTIHFISVRMSSFYCVDALKSNVLKMNVPVVCINDEKHSTTENYDNNEKFFNIKFPEKSEFEK